MTPHDVDEDDHAAERADLAILHDLAAAQEAVENLRRRGALRRSVYDLASPYGRNPTSGTPGHCHRHALPNTDGCPQCAAEDDDHIARYDAEYVWRYQRTHP